MSGFNIVLDYQNIMFIKIIAKTDSLEYWSIKAIQYPLLHILRVYPVVPNIIQIHRVVFSKRLYISFYF